MKKKVWCISAIGAAATIIAGFLFWTFFYREILQIRAMSIRPLDLSRVASGAHTGSFETPYKSYHVRVLVENHAIRRVQVTPGDDFMGYFDRKGLVIAEKVVAAQRIDVDAVSGATVTSKAVLKAIERALGGTRPPV